jgi:adenylosuccinate synthase
MNTVVLGLLRGDEGKGKIVDYLSEEHDIIVRFQGGPNAGHTIYRDDKKIVLHQIPSGIFNNKMCVIAHGCVVDPRKLMNEINMLIENGLTLQYIVNHLKVAFGCHCITPKHIQEDVNRENTGNGNGSTKCGISPAYRDKYYREGKRMYDLFKSTAEDDLFKSTCALFNLTKDEYVILRSLLIDDTVYLNYDCEYSKILFEGAQGVFLDIDNPVYPNVSSSHVNVGGVIAGSGISANKLKQLNVIGVIKAYMSSVGEGEFLTEIKDSVLLDNNGKEFKFSAETLRNAGKEFGATTGRPRRVGFLDLPMIKYACKTVGVNELCITRLDTLYEAFKDLDEFPVCIGYAKVNQYGITQTTKISMYDVNQYVPVYKFFKLWDKCTLDDPDFYQFISYITNYLNIHIKYISVGKDKDDIIVNSDKIEF